MDGKNFNRVFLKLVLCDIHFACILFKVSKGTIKK